jgi:hypothetical protein
VKSYASASLEPIRRASKKQHEERLAVGALRRMGLGVGIVEMHDRPDVIVRFPGDQLVGIEIRTIFADETAHGSAHQRFRSKWIATMNSVQAELAREHPVVPYCVVHFRNPSYESLRKLPQRSLVAEFVAVGRVLRSSPEIMFPVRDLPLLSSFLASVKVIDTDGSGLLWWPSHLQSGTVSSLDKAVAIAVREKAILGQTFNWRGACERWLLLVAQGHGPEDIAGHQRPFAVPMVASIPFTAIIVWDCFSEDIWTIFPDDRVICDGSAQSRDVSALPTAVRPFVASSYYPTRPKGS